MGVSELAGSIVVVSVLCAWAVIALTDEPRLPIGIANGSYSNDCCGSIVLKDGVMAVANQRISYIIERDKGGPYVLPKTYVGASNKRFVIKSDADALKLRLDDPVNPHQVELLDIDAAFAYPFVRRRGS